MLLDGNGELVGHGLLVLRLQVFRKADLDVIGQVVRDSRRSAFVDVAHSECRIDRRDFFPLSGIDREKF